jgi:hypothetical protein
MKASLSYFTTLELERELAERRIIAYAESTDNREDLTIRGGTDVICVYIDDYKVVGPDLFTLLKIVAEQVDRYETKRLGENV